MSLAIGHRLDQRQRLAERPEDPVGELDVHDVVAAADVVDLAVAAMVDQQVDRAAVVVDVQPVADVLPVAIERHGIGRRWRW